MANEFRKKINHLGSLKKKFVFVVDFECKEHIIETLPVEKLLFEMDDFSNYKNPVLRKKDFSLKPVYIPFAKYKNSFDKIIKEIKEGNTYLLNLTFQTKLNNDLNLKDIFYASQSRFKLYLEDKFVCFSPERFIKIQGNKIETHPMKGTIDAKKENAEERLLKDEKERAEHLMVVDLLRNDISMVASKVRVKKYRYVEKIKAGKRELLQVSSKITGKMEFGWQSRIGDILATLLPAGSITGTPKKMTTQIIKDTEDYERGFYTGVFGYFDGENLDSAVLIRYIEKCKDGFVYKSGGGVTLLSDAKKEYKEMCEKIYIPMS
ncbi:MAG: aminodeoxychorismate synthase component I [Sulfurospirillum sp.]